VTSSSKKEAIYNLDGQVFIPFKDYYYSFDNHTSSVPYIYIHKKNTFGYIDLNGIEIVFSEPFIHYKFGYFFSNTNSSKNNKGVFDTKGREIMPSIYKYLSLENKKIFKAFNREEELSYFDLEGTRIGKFNLKSNYNVHGSLSSKGFCIVSKKRQITGHHLPSKKYYIFNVHNGIYELIESSVKDISFYVQGFKTLGDTFSIVRPKSRTFYKVVSDKKFNVLKLI
jgi:hypothetical protein